MEVYMNKIVSRPKASLTLLAGVILPLVALICSIVIFWEEKA